MATKCNLPAFAFPPFSLPAFPGFSLPGFPIFQPAFSLPCPLD